MMRFNTRFRNIMNSTVITTADFVNKLQTQNLWSTDYACRVIEEYKKFIFLGLTQGVAPSLEIDQVWHLHILYTKDYSEMCKKLGINFFHHNPTDKTNITLPPKDNYVETKERYIKEFRIQPPKDIWTDWKYTNYVHLDLNTHWVIPAGDWKALIKLLFKYFKQ